MPVLAVTASAWVVVLVTDPFRWAAGHTPTTGASGSAPVVGGGPHHALEGAASSLGHTSHVTFGGFLAGWALMLTAMMAPLLIPALRHAHVRSLPRRRWRAMTLVTVAYAGAWTAAGLVILAVAIAVRGVSAGAGEAWRGAVAFSVGVVIVVVWQASPAKQRCLNRHHVCPPIAAFGWAADADALRLGGTHAASCFGSCWALMLVPLLAPGGHLVVMVLVTAWMWAERLDRPAEPAWQVRLPRRALRLAHLVTGATGARSDGRPRQVAAQS